MTLLFGGVIMADKKDFEEAFSEYLDSNKAEKAQNAAVTIMRDSFHAGWLAAGGNPVPRRGDFTVMDTE